MTRSVNSAFYQRMQEDGVNMALLIDLETRGKSFRWTSANDRITYTLSSNPTVYEPFPGQTLNGLKQTNDMAVSVIDFIVANTGDLIEELIDTNDLDYAVLRIGRVFISTPDLGRMEVFVGEIADYTYDRNAISGSVRNRWGSARIKWPYYNYQDKCSWRFGGTGCGFDASSITITFTAADVNTMTQRVITLNSGTLTQSYSNNRFDFGRLTVTDGPNSGHIRTIRSHSGDVLDLSHNLPVNSFTTFGFSVFPGCRKRREADCKSLYNNEENFMGFPWIPIQEDAF